MTERVFDTVIRGGTVVTSTGTMHADIGIVGETITALGSQLPGGRQRLMQAASLYCPAASIRMRTSNSYPPRAL